MDQTLTPDHQLLALRSLTQQTGALHEVQRKHLDAWSRAACPEGAVVKTVAWPEEKRVHVHYVVRGDDRIHPKILEIFTKCVRELLGPDWKVTVSRAQDVG